MIQQFTQDRYCTIISTDGVIAKSDILKWLYVVLQDNVKLDVEDAGRPWSVVKHYSIMFLQEQMDSRTGVESQQDRSVNISEFGNPQ